jgi:intergrase/recombinase
MRIGSVNLRSPQELQQFCDWLKSQGKTRWTVKQTKNYAIRYNQILQTENASELMTLSPRNRHHAMSALASLAKFQGQYDRFQQLKQRYSLKWTSGNESLQSFQRFFDEEITFDSMLQRIREMIAKTPVQMGQIIKFATLTGLRPSEAVESVKLLAGKQFANVNYYNPQRQALEHFRFPEIFIRATKKAYISFVSPEILEIVKSATGCRFPTSYNAIRLACYKSSIGRCDMAYCRKIFASWLHQCGIQSEIIDFLQGRVSKSVFSRHYLTPSQDLKDRVLEAVDKLRKEIEEKS